MLLTCLLGESLEEEEEEEMMRVGVETFLFLLLHLRENVRATGNFR